MERSDVGTANPGAERSAPGAPPLLDLREDLLAFCENLDQVFWVYDIEERNLVYVNRAYEQLWGKSVEELYVDAKAWQTAIHPEDWESVEAALGGLLEGDYDVTYRIVRPGGDVRRVRARAVSLLTDGSGRRRVIGLSEDVTDDYRAEEALTRMSADLSAETSTDYFQALVTHLAESCGADHVLVGLLDEDDPGLVRSVAMRCKGALKDDFQYRLKDSPCADLLGREMSCIPSGVQALYPADTDLVELGIEGYMGIRLSSSNEEVLGILVALFEQPLRDVAFVRTLFRVCAERAGAELARRRAESALELTNQELERRVVERTRDLRAANERLRASEERYRLFVQKSGEGIWCLEVDSALSADLPAASRPTEQQLDAILDTGRLVECNDIVAQRLRRPSADYLRGTPLADVDGFRCDEYRDVLARLIEGGAQVTDVDVFARLADGNERHLRCSFVGVFEPHGLRRIWCTERDVTDEVAAAERTRQHHSRLAHFSRLNAVGEMAAGIAHELNQPLAAIVNYTSGLVRHLGDSGDPLIRDALVSARAQAERAAEIIRRLRRFVRHGEHKTAACSLNEIVRETVGLLTPRLRQLRVDVELNLSAEPDLVVADATQIEQVLANLVRNSYEAMEAAEVAEPRVVITTSDGEDGRLLVEVRDQGPGLAPDAEEGAFQPFFSTRADGVGLGLAISRSIVEAHGGHLWWAAPAGGGAAFRFDLPRAQKMEKMKR